MVARRKYKSDEKNKSQCAKKLGAMGGKKGGPARAEKLSATERKKIARMGGKARQGRTGGGGSGARRSGKPGKKK